MQEGFPTQATGVSPADRLRQRRQACRRHTRRGVSPQPQRQSAQVGRPAHAAGSSVGTPKPPVVATGVQMNTDKSVLHPNEKRYKEEGDRLLTFDGLVR